MSNAGESSPSAAPEPADPSAPATSANRRTALFIVIFAASVFSVLTGYRYMVGTKANDWYLFQVARHTTFALGFFGESSTLEDLDSIQRIQPQQVRAALAAWDRGELEPADGEAAQLSDAPLTRWEAYEYRLQKTRRERPTAAIGPRVMFVLKSSDKSKLANLQEQIARGVSRGDDGNPAKKYDLDQLRENADALRTKIAAQPTGSPEEDTYSFPFMVVSECGAIEVMAIFFSAIIAFPTTWRKRGIGLLFGLPLMYGLNIFRLTALGYLGALTHGGELFDFAHEYVWQAVYIVFVVGVWMVWIEVVVRGRNT